MFFSVASGEKHQPFLDGPSVTDRVLEVGQGAGKRKYAVGYSWNDPDGHRYRDELQSSKTWVGELQVGDSIELRLNADDFADAIAQRALDEMGLVGFWAGPRRRSSTSRRSSFWRAS